MTQPELDQLQQSLDSAQPADAQQQAAVDTLKQDVQRSKEDSSHHATLRERLQEHMVLFQDSHPDLAGAMQSAINTLSLSGI